MGLRPRPSRVFLQDTASHRRQDVHLFVQEYSWAACPPAKLKRKEDETEDKAESGKKDYVSEVRESPLATFRGYLTPLRQDRSGNCAKLYGSFAALWFFLMKKDGPSLCRDHRKNSDVPGALCKARDERCTKGTYAGGSRWV